MATTMKEYKFILLEALRLPGVDRSGTSDPYVVFSYEPEPTKANSVKSSTISKTLHPKWNQEEMPPLLAPKDAVLYIHVFDANRFSKDVLLGRAQVQLDELRPFLMRAAIPVLVPLDTQGWVKFTWKVGPSVDLSKLHSEPYVLGLSRGEFKIAQFKVEEVTSTWREVRTLRTSIECGLQTVIRFLGDKLYTEQGIRHPRASALSVGVKAEDDVAPWADCLSKWTPELLTDVSSCKLTVSKASNSDEVRSFLRTVKDSGSITSFSYEQHDPEPNDAALSSLVESLPMMHHLHTLEIYCSNLEKSALRDKLLVSLAGLKLHSLTLWLPAESDMEVSQLVKATPAKSLSFHLGSVYNKEFKSSSMWTSLVDSLRDCSANRLGLHHESLARDAMKQLVQAVLEMPALEEFEVTKLKGGLVEAVPLLSSPKLKGLTLSTGYPQTDGDLPGVPEFLDAAIANVTLERLDLHGRLFAFHPGKLQEFASNSSLKILYLEEEMHSRLDSCDEAVLDAFASNTTLQRAILNVCKSNNKEYPARVERVANVWKQRGAFFSYRKSNPDELNF